MRNEKKEIGLYIHIPFCKTKCGYCDFFSITDLSLMDRYVKSVVDYIDYFKSRYQNKIIKTIFFGGGTPSLLEEKNINLIFNKIYDSFYVKKDAEITFEANPEHTSEKFLNSIKNVGVNRLSFGVQSAVKNELLILDRNHENHHVISATENANKIGITNYSFDIIQSIPYQTITSLDETLNFIVNLRPKHVSTYMLILEEDTPLYKKSDQLKFLSDDEEADLYTHSVTFLEKHGLMQYEISNFAKKGYESKHNLIYWEGDEYLAIGPSGHSFMENKRFYFENNLGDFLKNSSSIPNIKYLDDGGDVKEYIMLNLRLKKGISVNTLKDKFKLSEKTIDDFINKANFLSQQGLAIFKKGNLHLTTEGFLVSNLCIGKMLENIN